MDSMENKPKNSLVVFLAMTHYGMSSSLCCREVAGPSIPVVVAQSNCRLAKRANENITI